MRDEPLVLGIETSCDETGVGIVRGMTLLADAVATSVAEHERFGGVVPEIASRAHLESMTPILERACSDAGVRLRDVDAIAVTSGPGLPSPSTSRAASRPTNEMTSAVGPCPRSRPTGTPDARPTSCPRTCSSR